MIYPKTNKSTFAKASLMMMLMQLISQSTTAVDVTTDEELAIAKALFDGPVESVAEHPEFAWLESPVGRQKGNSYYGVMSNGPMRMV
jgi:hypothetical protein